MVQILRLVTLGHSMFFLAFSFKSLFYRTFPHSVLPANSIEYSTKWLQKTQCRLQTCTLSDPNLSDHFYSALPFNDV